MKVKIRPEHDGTGQMNDWPAEFRDGQGTERTDADDAGPADADPGGPGYAVPAGYGHAVPAGPGHGKPASYVRAVPAGPGYAMPAGSDHAGPAAGSARPQAPPRPLRRSRPLPLPSRPGPPSLPRPLARPGAAVRAVIGDQLRMPVMWCEMGSCICWHADPAALGEADCRARAIAAGWRIDALGRLACPRCQQVDPGYWTARPVVPRTRDAAIARTVPIPAVPGDGTAGRAAPPGSRDPGRAARGLPPASRAEPEWHHESPGGQAVPAGRDARDPAGTSHSRSAVLGTVRAWRARGRRQAATSPG